MDNKNRKLVQILLILYIITTTVSAITINYEVHDLNTRVLLDNVSIEITNGTSDILNSSFTVDGFLTLEANDIINNYTNTLVKTGYYDYILTETLTEETYYIFHMIPISTDGYVNLVGSDLTLDEHEIFIFDKETGRLLERYHMNETIRLIVNKEYIIKPQLTKKDLFSSVNNIRKNIYLYSELVYGIALMTVIVMIIFGLIMTPVIIILYKRGNKK